jgi:transposase
MRQKSGPEKQPAEDTIRDIRRATRRHFSAEEKIRIVLEGLRGEESIAELCRREGIASSMYYGWSKEFLEAGKRRLAGGTARAATSDEVKDLRREAQALKEVVADLTLENRLLKKSMIGDLMNANSASHPGMPRVDDLDLVASFRTVCLLVRSCTIRSAGTPPSAISARLSSKGRSD